MLGIWNTLLKGGDAKSTWVFMGWEGVEAQRKGVELNAFYLDQFGIPYGPSPLLIALPETVKGARRRRRRRPQQDDQVLHRKRLHAATRCVDDARYPRWAQGRTPKRSRRSLPPPLRGSRHVALLHSSNRQEQPCTLAHRATRVVAIDRQC